MGGTRSSALHERSRPASSSSDTLHSPSGQRVSGVDLRLRKGASEEIPCESNCRKRRGGFWSGHNRSRSWQSSQVHPLANILWLPRSPDWGTRHTALWYLVSFGMLCPHGNFPDDAFKELIVHPHLLVRAGYQRMVSTSKGHF